MRKTITILMITGLNFCFSQFNPTGTSTTDDKYRRGGLALGFSTTPLFGTNKFMVKGNSYFEGNIGIGTSDPITKLHLSNGDFNIENGKMYLGFEVQPPILIDNADVFGFHSNKSILLYSEDRMNFSMGRNDGQISTSFEIGLCHNNSTWAPNSLKGDVVLRTKAKNFIFYQETGDNFKFVTTSDPNNSWSTTATRLMINKFGNVGIGTGDSALNSNDLLSVNGTIHAKEVRVDLTGWPDYVFEENYNLQSLEEIEKFINKEKHLPGIPSASEIEKDGLKLAEMNKILMEKVEELTLHLISLNKEIEKLKKEDHEDKK